ncbi:hypothetical protein [Flagellimonas sediminis]|uniref:DUF4843 domain-containing protein n=1 Tax=Flagellimonas sediminis TaxID=2696468 RepID=A0A6I5KTS0_9FLAO|nr:hypothetical protein [Allomuricauda sediminis]NDV44266.1 hypothetical protein [Allomuricauda sediminis]
MKKSINTLVYTATSLLMLSLVACDALLDQEETDFGKGPIVVQFQQKSITNNFLQDGSGTVYDFEIPIEYQGADGNPLGEDVTVTIGINSESTANEDVEFSLSQTEFVIPAGQKSANVVIQVNSESLDALNPKTVILEILNSSQTVSDKNTTAITLQAICPSNLEGNYMYINGNESAVTITSTGTGTYEVSRDNAFTNPYPLYISDVCNTLTIPGSYIMDNFGIATSGAGSVDPDTGTITLYYTVDGYFADREMILIKQ